MAYKRFHAMPPNCLSMHATDPALLKLHGSMLPRSIPTVYVYHMNLMNVINTPQARLLYYLFTAVH